MKGKHEAETMLQRLIEKSNQLNKELDETRLAIRNVFDTVLELNESNDYGSPEVRKRLISEICRNTIKELDKPLNYI